MELQTFAQQYELYGYSNKDLYNLLQGDWENFEKNLEEHYHDNNYGANNYYYEMGSDQFDDGHQYMTAAAATGGGGGSEELEFSSCTNHVVPADEQEFPVPVAEEDSTNTTTTAGGINIVSSTSSTRSSRRRRSRATRKNQEEIENQRMAHIAVERNRRKQMNDYLAVLRGLMPEYYVLKADQASIIGGAINYVKELEQQLQFLGILRPEGSTSSSSPFSEFFTFPQYSSTSSNSTSTGCEKSTMTAAATMMSSTDHDDDHHGIYNMSCDRNDPFLGRQKNRYAAADIEVTMVESHANLKVRSKRRPKQLLKMVSGLQNLRLTVLHLNVVTTVDQLVLYSLSLKVEDDCNLASVDDIAAAVNQILSRIQEDACWI